ncbi:hypothetical protein FOL47_006549, partial [Perkinsus chesapeaki]
MTTSESTSDPRYQHGSTAENGTQWDWVSALEKQVMEGAVLTPVRPSPTVLANLTPLATVEAILGIGGYNRWLDAMSVFRTSNGKELGTDVNGYLIDHAISVMRDSEADTRLACVRTQLSDFAFKEGLTHSMRSTGLGLVGHLILLSTVLSPALAQNVEDILVDMAAADDSAYLWTEKYEDPQSDKDNCLKWLEFVRKVNDEVMSEWSRVVHEEITVSEALAHYSSLRWTKQSTLDQLILKERDAFHYLSRAGDGGVTLGDDARLDVLNRCLRESHKWGYVLTPELNQKLWSAKSVADWILIAKKIRSDSRRSGLSPDREYQPVKSEGSSYASCKVEHFRRLTGRKKTEDENKVQVAVKKRLYKAREVALLGARMKLRSPLRATTVMLLVIGVLNVHYRDLDKSNARRLAKDGGKVSPRATSPGLGERNRSARVLRARRAAAAKAPDNYKSVSGLRVHATQTATRDVVDSTVPASDPDASENEGDNDQATDECTSVSTATQIQGRRSQQISTESCGMNQVSSDTSKLDTLNGSIVTLDNGIKCAVDQLVKYRDYDSVLPVAVTSAAGQDVLELERVDPESIRLNDYVVYRSPGNDWLFEVARVNSVDYEAGAADVPFPLILCKVALNNKDRITRRSRQDLNDL